jgi:hypothetical protein
MILWIVVSEKLSIKDYLVNNKTIGSHSQKNKAGTNILLQNAFATIHQNSG